MGFHGEAHHAVVFHDPSRWAAVPANNGANGPAWQWGNEILVGFTVGAFARTEKGHQCRHDEPFVSWLARSTDGAESWRSWRPEGYAGENRGPPVPCADSPELQAPGFVLRVEGHGYHGNSGCRWFCSTDRGEHWRGPFSFGSLLEHPDLADTELTARTAYLVTETRPAELLLFLSARPASSSGRLEVAIAEKSFLARTRDGRSFELVSWVIPWSDPYRAVMAAPVRLTDSRIVVALRRKSRSNNWIDCCETRDGGRTWRHLSRVDDTEAGNLYNGNPPALVALADGRLCCVYGNRTERRILARFSSDSGLSWSQATVVRDDFDSANGWPDLGYPRLFQRPDGLLAVVYFWCTRSRPETHIEATVFPAP